MHTIRRFVAVVLAVLSLAAIGMPGASAQEPGYDILIRNARVVDGTGNPWFISDVGIRGDRIAAMARHLEGDAGRIIDADGRVLAPGFIDVHTHVESGFSRAGIERLPRAENYLLDGVTTIVTGNCGSSEIDIPAWTGRLEGLGLNIATLIGHNSVRRAVMGPVNRAPTSAELEKMEALVANAMENGAVGLSTGLLYVPGTYADTAEVVALAKVASSYGGIYASHIREQGAKLHGSIEEAIEIGRQADMPVQISHLKIKGRTRWGSIGDALDLIDSHRRRGVDVAVDVYPYDRASTSLGVTLPRWAVSGRAEDIAGRINDSETRERMVSEMKAALNADGYPDYSYATVAQFRPNPELNGLNISEINVAAGREATIDGEIETILEMMLAGGEAGATMGAQMVYHYMGSDDVDTILQYPNASVASDGNINVFGRGLPHPRSYGTNARVLAQYVRERQVLGLEEAVRRMTSLPARSIGVHNRGIVRPGLIADLVIFDPETVQDLATFDEPHQYSEGFDTVIVNGVAVVSDGSLTDERPGRFVARGGD